MSISTNNTGFTNTTNNTLLFQDWNSNTPSVFQYNTTNAAYPSMLTIPITIKDVIGTPAGDQYPTKRLLVEKTYIGLIQLDWLTTSIDSEVISDVKTFSYTNGMIKDLLITPNNLIGLLPGEYDLKLKFTIQGRIPFFSSWQNISSYEHFVKIYVNETGFISWIPSTFNLTHIQNIPFPYFDIVMSGDNWKLTTPPLYVFTSPNNDVTINEITTPMVGVSYEAIGSGTKTVRFTLSDFFNANIALVLNPFSEEINVYRNNNFQGKIPFNLFVSANLGFVALPSSLLFNAFKNVQEAEPIIVDVYTTFPYTYTKPVWLNMEVLAESSPGLPSKFLVYPISSANLAEGSYVDDIIFTYNTGSVSATDLITVNHNVYDYAVIPYSNSKINFTKDLKFIEFFSDLNDVYFQLIIDVTSFDFISQSNQTITKSVPLKIPLFEQKQNQNIGLIVEKILFSSNKPYNNNQYKAAEVRLTLNQISHIDNSFISTVSTNIYRFLSGLSPKNIVQDCAILDINTNMKRVTSKSFAYINLMLTIENKNVTIKKNQETVFQYGITTQVDTYRETIDFSIFDLNKGDVLHFIIELENNETISKSFIVFPEGDYSTMILFEDEARLIQSFEFTGKYSFKDEFETISQKIYQNLVEVQKKYDYTKDVSFSINTGFISKGDVRTIQSICESKRAWIYLTDEEMIEIIPLTKTLPTFDVDTELINFDLEFQINRKYNEESYTF